MMFIKDMLIMKYKQYEVQASKGLLDIESFYACFCLAAAVLNYDMSPKDVEVRRKLYKLYRYGSLLPIWQTTDKNKIISNEIMLKHQKIIENLKLKYYISNLMNKDSRVISNFLKQTEVEEYKEEIHPWDRLGVIAVSAYAVEERAERYETEF